MSIYRKAAEQEERARRWVDRALDVAMPWLAMFSLCAAGLVFLALAYHLIQPNVDARAEKAGIVVEVRTRDSGAYIDRVDHAGHISVECHCGNGEDGSPLIRGEAP